MFTLKTRVALGIPDISQDSESDGGSGAPVDHAAGVVRFGGSPYEAAIAAGTPTIWATSRLGTTSHLSEEMLNRGLKLKMEIVAYKGAVPQLTDVIGGHVSAAVSPMPGVHSFVQAGRLRALAVTSKTRTPNMPDAPTVAESGVPGFELLSWYGVWGPADMPADITQRLNAKIAKVVDAPALKSRFAEQSFVPAKSSPNSSRSSFEKTSPRLAKPSRKPTSR